MRTRGLRVSILTRGKPRVELAQSATDDGPNLVSILTRGKPRVERDPWSLSSVPSLFQSSLEENPEWNATFQPIQAVQEGFNPHSRKTPSGTTRSWEWRQISCVSILTRGKPRVEQYISFMKGYKATVSILTRGKPRVERSASAGMPESCSFQSSLEENPEWNG